MKKVLKVILATGWCFYCIYGIITNAHTYNIAGWLIVVLVSLSPFIIITFIKKRKKSNATNVVIPNAKQNIPHEVVPSGAVISNPKTAFDIESIRILFANIPENILNLLWIKDVNCFDTSEPSMIDLSFLISLDDRDEIGKLDYYPSYAKLTPRQRFVYLSWLEDISKPIDIGYVFLFYYGLERHLFYGDFDGAYSVINTLRIFHDNASFKAYSSDALLLSMAYHKRLDLLANYDFSTTAPEVAFYLKHNMKIPINSIDLINIRKRVGFTNDRYIKENYDNFKNIMDDILIQKYGTATFLTKDSFFATSEAHFTIALANYSLDRRYTHIPNITRNSEFSTLVFAILQETHESYKTIKRTGYKQNPSKQK